MLMAPAAAGAHPRSVPSIPTPSVASSQTGPSSGPGARRPSGVPAAPDIPNPANAANAGNAPDVPAAAAPPIELSAASLAFGEAVALIDLRKRVLRWTSPAWHALLPTLVDGRPLAAVEEALPGLAGHWPELAAGAASPARLCLGSEQQWDGELAALDAGHAVLRLADRRERGRALQRQLDDREQLLFTSRVISVGEMASTLAHELNQPIGACANLLRGLRARLTRRAAGLAGEEAEALDRAIDQAMYASRVIARIRDFTHSHQPRHVRLDWAALVRASAALLDWDSGRTGARVDLQLPPAGVQVRGDEVMLQQVVVNLVRNALDALRTDPPEDPQVTLQLVVGPKEAELRVLDNGCGLADEAAARLFVPFASSKPNGMGIGLSICRSFVELHQGRLWFSRPAGRGACFHVSLPLSA